MIDIVKSSGIIGMDLSFVMGLILQYLVVMLRVGAFTISSPFFGARYVPLPVRIIASAALAMPIFTYVPLPDVDTLTQLKFIPFLLQEIIIGLAGGLTLTIMFACASIAGDRIANSAGLGFASQIDPNSGTQTPVVAQILALMILATFLSQDGHLIALRIVLDSYTLLPISSTIHLSVALEVGIRSAGQMFFYGMQLMLPVATILLLVNTVIGVITRSAPQLNIFSFGFPLTLMVSIVLLYLTAPTMTYAMSIMIDVFLTAFEKMFGGMLHG